MSDTTALKDYFDGRLARHLSELITPHYTGFPAESFISAVEKRAPPFQLKARVAVINSELRESLPADYTEALGILLQILGPENETEEGMFTKGYYLMPVAHFVEVYGLEHFKLSMEAMYEITKRHTSEYTIRPYLTNYPEDSYQILEQWSTDENAHVRRLVSEGTRPRLPWTKKTDVLKGDVQCNLALLERFLDDPSPYVRKSVANHLNDLTKSHPVLVVNWIQSRLDSGGPYMDRLARHGLRTLVKKEDAGALGVICALREK